MSVPVWPTELPRPTRQGYQTQKQDGRLRRSAGGPPGYRRRFSSTARMVNLSVELTRLQKAVFDDFLEDRTAGGSLPFYMPDPVTEGWALLTSAGVPIVSSSGAPVTLVSRLLCLFDETMPVEVFVAERFQISFAVAVMP